MQSKKTQKVIQDSDILAANAGKKYQKQNATNQTKTTSSFCDDEQIQAVYFIVSSPVGRKLEQSFYSF